jgi:hypothetical protein
MDFLKIQFTKPRNQQNQIGITRKNTRIRATDLSFGVVINFADGKISSGHLVYLGG